MLPKTDFKILGFSHNAFAKSVLIRPGAIELALIFLLPNSAAIFFTIITSAALLMLYAPKIELPLIAAMLEMIIMDPSSLFTISGKTKLHRI